MVLVDNNVLSAFAKIERLALLADVFETVRTPAAVIDELHRAAAAGYEFVERIDAVKSYNGGWLTVVPPTERELQLADDIRDHALSTTDAQCLAIAERRAWRLLTDDAHIGTVGQQRGIDVWDLPLFLSAAIEVNVIETQEDLSATVDALRERDN